MMKALGFLASALAVAASPAAAEPARASVPPVQGLAHLFVGHFEGEGQFVNSRDGTTRGMKIDIVGRLEGKALTLVEDTVFSDGEKQHKVWTFTRDGANSWIGRRPDVIGNARVTLDGDRIRMVYRAHVPKDGHVWDLKFDERYQIRSPDLILDRTDVSFLFFTVGVAHLTIRRTK